MIVDPARDISTQAGYPHTALADNATVRLGRLRGSVGWPDLMGEGMSAAALAELGYDTWKDNLARLPRPRASSRRMAPVRSVARI